MRHGDDGLGGLIRQMHDFRVGQPVPQHRRGRAQSRIRIHQNGPALTIDYRFEPAWRCIALKIPARRTLHSRLNDEIANGERPRDPMSPVAFLPGKGETARTFLHFGIDAQHKS